MSNEGRNAYVIEHMTDALLKAAAGKAYGIDISIRELARAGRYRAGILLLGTLNSKEDILRATHPLRFLRIGQADGASGGEHAA